MMSSNKSPGKLNSSESVTLSPSYRLPILVISFGIGLSPLPISLWISIVTSLFGIFLLVQSLILRLEFTTNDLIVWQLSRELRRFPFKDWIAWRILFPGMPGLFYFRETASPHLLPILFNPKELEDQLRLRVEKLETPKNGTNVIL